MAGLEGMHAQQGRPGTAPRPPQLPRPEAWQHSYQGSDPLQPFLMACLDSSTAQGAFPALPQPRVGIFLWHQQCCHHAQEL